jgi:hypothetical protein
LGFRAIGKAKNRLVTLGIRARKDERARLARLAEYKAQDELPPIEDLAPIREPNKNPTAIELARCREDFYPELEQQVREFKNHQEPPHQISPQDDDDDDVVITITGTLIVEKDVVGEYIDSSPPLDYQDLSDDESNAGSIDSIPRNADFVSFE